MYYPKGPALITRRGFLKRTMRASALTAAGPVILPSPVLGRAGVAGPNNRIGVGFIGVGRRGRQLMRLPADAEIVAVSDVNAKRMEEVAAGEKWKKYPDYRRLLDDRDVDAVIIATPDHWHALTAVHACRAAKDVYCEKPLSLTVREGRAMVRAARRHKRVFQTGSQQRSMDACRLGCELVRNGRLGNLIEVHGANYASPWECTLPGQPVPDGLDWDMWVGQTPSRPYHTDIYLPRANPGWISFRPYSGGEMTGWGSHGLDIIQWALGMDDTGPVEVWPEGQGLDCPVGFRYENGVTVLLNDKGPRGGGLFIGDGGYILVDRGKCDAQPREIAGAPLKDSDTRLYKSMDHMKNWLDCVRTRERPVADVEIGHRTATLCHLCNIARWMGRRLKWDPAKEKFVDDPEANDLLKRPMRPPWRL